MRVWNNGIKNISRYTIIPVINAFLMIVFPFPIIFIVEKISIGFREKAIARNIGNLLNWITSSGILSISKCAQKSKYFMKINSGAAAKKLIGKIIKKMKNKAFANFKIIENIFLSLRFRIFYYLLLKEGN